MAERAGLFEGDDFDLSAFTPKKPATSEPLAEAVRAISETADFRSREPLQRKKPDRRHRTGRNEQLNLKVTSKARDMFYAITEQQGWVQGFTFERAVAALERELLNRAQVKE
jgi:hypothetical protein